MEADYWIGELGRLYLRSSEAIEKGQNDAVEPLTKEFNEALDQLKVEFDDNEIVSKTESVESHTEGTYEKGVISPARLRDEALHEIRSRCEKMANALDFELPERQANGRRMDQMVMVSVEQESTQEVEQEVTVEEIIQLIDVDPTVQGSRGDLKNLVEEFEEELETEDPDEGLLRQFIEEAKDYSTSVAAKMAIRAIQAGLVGVLAL